MFLFFAGGGGDFGLHGVAVFRCKFRSVAVWGKTVCKASFLSITRLCERTELVY